MTTKIIRGTANIFSLTAAQRAEIDFAKFLDFTKPNIRLPIFENATTVLSANSDPNFNYYILAAFPNLKRFSLLNDPYNIFMLQDFHLAGVKTFLHYVPYDYYKMSPQRADPPEGTYRLDGTHPLLNIASEEPYYHQELTTVRINHK